MSEQEAGSVSTQPARGMIYRVFCLVVILTVSSLLFSSLFSLYPFSDMMSEPLTLPTTTQAQLEGLRSPLQRPLHRRVISASSALEAWRLSPSGQVDEGGRSLTQAMSRCEDRSETSVKLLDARDLSALYYWGHAPFAQHTPWRMFTRGRRSGELLDRGQLTTLLRSLGLCASDRIFIYGDWTRGWGEEARMLWLLEYAGHDRVALIEGGWRAWLRAGGSRERGGARDVSPSDWDIAWRDERRADTSQVARLIERGVTSLDARSLREFEGATPYGSTRGGRLPHSVHLPWERIMDERGRLRAPAELRTLFESSGARTDEPIFTYCTGGVRSAFIYLALREAGFDQAMNYDGSWWAWSAQHER